MIKRPNNSKELRCLISYVTLDISYNNDKKVRIRKIHKDTKTEELKKPKYKIEGFETYIYDNQIDLDIFYIMKNEPLEFFRYRYLKPECEEFKTQIIDLSRYGADMFRIEKYFPEHDIDWKSNDRIDIYVSMKNPDEHLNDNLCSILHNLCKKYLKTSIMISGKDTIICRIYDCFYSRFLLKNFIEDFVISTEKTILKEI
jgi:hypothetical protein